MCVRGERDRDQWIEAPGWGDKRGGMESTEVEQLHGSETRKEAVQTGYRARRKKEREIFHQEITN